MKKATLISPDDRRPDLFQEDGLTLEQIKQNLDGISHNVERDTYFRPLAGDEIDQRKDQLIDQSIKINKTAQEKSDATADFNATLKTLGISNKKILRDITLGAIEEDGLVYHVLSDDNKEVNEYNAEGRWLRTRKPLPEERQRHINMSIAS